MVETVTCPLCGETYEIINAYRDDEWFHAKVNALAEMNDSWPMEILTTGKWKEPVPDELLGLT